MVTFLCRNNCLYISLTGFRRLVLDPLYKQASQEFNLTACHVLVAYIRRFAVSELHIFGEIGQKTLFLGRGR